LYDLRLLSQVSGVPRPKTAPSYVEEKKEEAPKMARIQDVQFVVGSTTRNWYLDGGIAPGTPLKRYRMIGNAPCARRKSEFEKNLVYPLAFI